MREHVRLVGSLLPTPLPERPDPVLRQLWLDHAPAGALDDQGTGDYEDWTEMACRLRALLASGADDLWLTWGTGRAHRYASDARGRLRWTMESVGIDTVAEWLAQGEAIHYGPLAGTSCHQVSPLMPLIDRRADRYYQQPAFLRHAGRRSVVAGIRDVDEPPIFGEAVQDVMAQNARAGYEWSLLKDRTAKRGLWQVHSTTDPAANKRALINLMEWDWVRLAGMSEALIVQPWVEMGCEYRTFVVDGQVVTGAGCVETDTPLQNDGFAFSPRLEHVRNDGDVREDWTLAREAALFAVRVAAKAGTVEFGGAYVLDVAKVEGDWGVVECNPLDNAGLYASDPALVTKALVRAERTRQILAVVGR